LRLAERGWLSVAVVVVLIVASVLVAGGFLAAFIWSTRSGQFDDTNTPAHRILFDDPQQPTKNDNNTCTRE
jgi:cbb3-type cytochrome oxidase maturation protein